MAGGGWRRAGGAEWSGLPAAWIELRLVRGTAAPALPGTAMIRIPRTPFKIRIKGSDY